MKESMNTESNEIYKLFSENNNGKLIKVLDKLGKLSDNFDNNSLVYLLEHENEKIRCLAVKNLAKTEDVSLKNTYIKLINNDSSSVVKREAASAIGRLRNKECIPTLLNLLSNSDPEVAMQAIRGLLVFKEDKLILDSLKKLKNHPNEMIQEVINKEFYCESSNGYDPTHRLSPDYLKNAVIYGDSINVLKLIPDNSIHLTFTSPPYYNARDYSTYLSYNDYLNFLESIFKEVHRITKEGRFLVLNTSPIIIPRVGRQYSSKRYPIPYDIHPLLIKMGWEFIDDIVWAKPEASVKNRNAGFLQHRKPLAYKPNARTECVMVYRKKTEKLIDWNIKQYPMEIVNESKINGDYESSNVWEIDPTFDRTHSAVFPLDLCNKVIKFYSFKGDLIFDPFAGSGTLGKSALNLSRYFLLIEKELKYIDRIKENLGQMKINYYKNQPTKFFTESEFKKVIK